MAVDRIVWKILLDFFVLACLGLPLLAFLLWFEPYHRGFFESDLSIKLPFKPQSISEALLAGVGFAFIILTILITEIVRNGQGRGVGEKFLSGSLVPGWVWESYTTIGIFTFGAACQQLTSNITKFVIGRLRPHFYDLKLSRLVEAMRDSRAGSYLAQRISIAIQSSNAASVLGTLPPSDELDQVCQPIYNASAPLNARGYIQDFRCLHQSESRLKDIRLSFPSAHSSFSMYCAVFFIFYVQVKGRWRGSKLLRHGFQFAVLMAAWYVGLTRVQEHYHHWSDVAVGYLIGAVYGALVFIFVLKPKKYGEPGITLPWEPTAQNVLPRPVLAR